MNENKLFLKIIEEKFQRFKDYYVMGNSDFLTLEQQSMLVSFMRNARHEGAFFYGGYSEAERRMVVFRLGGWAPRLHTEFLVLSATLVPLLYELDFVYGDFTLFVRTFQISSTINFISFERSTTPLVN